MIARLVLFLFLCTGCVHGSCLKENMTCLSSDIMDIRQPVANPYLCQAMCADMEDCSAFTWTTEGNTECELSCFLFATISNQTTCKECVSGPPSCTCSYEAECHGDVDNILDALPGVQTEVECMNWCATTPSCMFYTWHDATSFPSYTCILLTSCDVTNNSCSGCFSGPPACSSEILTTTPAPATEGIIISGGLGAKTSVEVFVPSTGLSCSLPALPGVRFDHTMDSLLICGGKYSSSYTTCLTFTSGQWITSHTLVEQRDDHTSWQTEQGLVLMGGRYSHDTSEIVATAGGQGGPSFAMQYSTKRACSMPDLTSDSVIITGGVYTMSTVSRYGVLGWVEDLPSLVVGRSYHGCGSYFRGDSQVLLVAGGLDNSNNRLSSTEVLTMDSPGWTLTTPLPRAVYGVRGVTIGGSLYMTGGYDGNERDEIMGWLDDEQEWEETGKMKMGRESHALSTIQMDDQVMEHCG